MTKLVILNPNERHRFDSAPALNADERSLYFSFSNEEMKIVKSLRTTCNRIGFAIQLAYFKTNGKFFSVNQFKQEDISYATKTLGIVPENIDLFNTVITNLRKQLDKKYKIVNERILNNENNFFTIDDKGKFKIN